MSALLAFALLAGSPQTEPAAVPIETGPALRVEDLERWRAHLRPRESELRFEALAWLPDLAAGLAAADARHLPLLLWVSAGHPLGSASAAGIGERALFDDERVTSLARNFVPVADDARRLASGSGADCELFRDAVRASPWRSALLEGLWVVAPDGALLAHASTRNPALAARALFDGFQAWKEVPDERRKLPEYVSLDPTPASSACPEEGLVLERIARDIGPEAPSAEPSPHWNRGYAWFERDEVAGLVPAEPEVGEAFDLSPLVERLARFDLVDDVHGNTEPYAPEDVETARLVARVTGREGDVVALELEGHTRAEGEGFWSEGYGIWAPRHEPPHGIECDLVGRGEFHLTSGTFAELELVALGHRWGRTERNGRRQASAEGWIALWLSRAPEGVCTPPAFLAAYGEAWNPAPGARGEAQH